MDGLILMWGGECIILMKVCLSVAMFHRKSIADS